MIKICRKLAYMMSRLADLLEVQHGYYINPALGMMRDDQYTIAQRRHFDFGRDISGFFRVDGSSYLGCHLQSRSFFHWGNQRPINPLRAAAWQGLVKQRCGPWLILPLIGWFL